jgi:threonine dehydrogenase-like Zn-dependent dehydrogenase
VNSQIDRGHPKQFFVRDRGAKFRRYAEEHALLSGLDSRDTHDEKQRTMSTVATVETQRVMRAARILAPQKLVIEDAPIPEPLPHEVRIRVKGCGVCASNLGPWLGLPWTQYPFAPGQSGHEAWGEIDAVGRDVSGVRIGDAVSAVSYNAYAEYDVAPEASVVKIPDALRGKPFPGEPLGCAMNVFRRSRIEPGQSVAVVGIGFMGALLTELAASIGARVIAISRRPYALRIARDKGASEVIPMIDHGQIVERVRELTDGEFCDRVIEAVGTQWPLDLSAELTATNGVLVIAGYHQDGPRQVNMQLWNWRGIDVVNAHERRPERYVHGIQSALEAIESKIIKPEPLYTHHYPLERLGEALDATADRPDGFLKALINL